MKSIIFVLISILGLAGTATAQQQPQNDSQGWVRLFTGSAAGLNAVNAHGDDTVYASGGALLRSIDGGTTWQTIGNTPVTTGEMFFTDDTTGFIVSGQQVYRTIDGGQAWSDTTLDIAGAGNSILFQGDTGWIAGHFIYRTTDGGKVWHQENGEGNNCIAFAPDGMHGYIMGDAHYWTWRPAGGGEVSFTAAFLERTTDGGVNWDEPYYDSLYLPQRMSTVGYTFIPWGVLGVATTSTNTIIAVGGGIAKSMDGGDNWDTILTSEVTLYAVCFPDSMHGTAVGGNGLILHTTDGGNTWNKQNSGLTSAALYSVVFADSLHGYASGSQGAVIKTTDGGLSWVNISPLSDNMIKGTVFPQPASANTSIAYNLPEPQHVTLSIQNITGINVANVLVGQLQSAGLHTIPLDIRELSCGTYFVRIQTEKYFNVIKFQVICE